MAMKMFRVKIKRAIKFSRTKLDRKKSADNSLFCILRFVMSFTKLFSKIK